MLSLISNSLEQKGAGESGGGGDKDKIFGISLTVFCKIMLRLMETQENDEDPKEMEAQQKEEAAEKKGDGSPKTS